MCEIALFSIEFLTYGADESHETLITNVFRCDKSYVKFPCNFKRFALSE